MVSSTLHALNDKRCLNCPESYKKARLKDFLWIADLTCIKQEDIPMWVGWNARQTIKKQNTLQKVWCLLQINEAPTSISVVQETMKRAQKIAKKFSRKTIAVTYDLAIAKSSMQLQAEGSPTYDKLFINMGGFHIELTFFSALGEYIEESGGPHVLQEAGVIRKFSLKSFNMGKAYNRCKRIHQLFAAALEILQMQAFLSRKEEECYEQFVYNEIENIRNGGDYTLSKEVQDMLDYYKEYLEETKTRKYGKTAQFWIGCTEWMHLYHE